MKLPKILILTTDYYPILGGVETHARRLAVYLSKQGFSVVILTRKVPGASYTYQKLDGISVYRIPPGGNRRGINKWLMIPFALLSMIKIKYLYDLIYCPGYRGIGVAAILAGILLGRKVILKSGNIGILSCSNWDFFFQRWKIPPHGFLSSLIKWPIRRIYSMADGLVCISQEIKREALESNISPSKIYYIPETVDCKLFKPPYFGEKAIIRLQEGWPKDNFIILYVGRLSHEKGVLDLIEACRFLNDRPVVLILVGPEMPGHAMDAGPAVRQRILELDVIDRVILYGPSENIPHLLRGADIFVQPSHYEAFGISVIEAMATGLPVVATSVGGMNDYLIGGFNALLCKPHSPGNLGKQILLLINDDSLRHRLGQEALSTVKQKFEERALFDKFARLFTDIAIK